MSATLIPMPAAQPDDSDENVGASDGAIENSVAKSLAGIAPFQDLPDAVLELLNEQSDCRHYSAGQTVFSHGQFDGGEFFVVIKGKMRVSLVDSASGAMLIEEFAEKSVFGLEIVLVAREADAYQNMSVTAEEELELFAIDAEAFRSLAAGRPSLMRNIAFYLADQLATLRFKAMASQAAPEQRIFAVLLEYVERDAVSGAWRISKMPKHRELADRANVDEADAASAVAMLIQEGVARRDYPGLVIADIARLNQLAH